MTETVCLIGLQIRAYKGSDYKSDPAALNNIGAHPEEQGNLIFSYHDKFHTNRTSGIKI